MVDALTEDGRQSMSRPAIRTRGRPADRATVNMRWHSMADSEEVSPTPAPGEQGLAGETMMGLAVGRPNEITLAVQPVQRFAILRAIRTQIRAQPSVVDVRLEQLERGVAVFRIRHLGTLPVADAIAEALEPLGLDVSSVEEINEAAE